MPWYIVKASCRPGIKRPSHVLVGDEHTTIWTPSFERGTRFLTYSRAKQVLAAQKASALVGREKIKIVNQRKLDRYTLEWALIEGEIR